MITVTESCLRSVELPIEYREAIFNSFRNIGFKDDKPADEKLLLNHSTYKGETGDLVILIGANNSGKSNILDGLKTYQIVQIMGGTRDIKYCASQIEYNQRWIEDNQRYIEDYQRYIECYQRDIERCLQQIEDCQRLIEDYQLKLGEDGLNLLKRAQTTLYSGEEYRNPKVVIPLIKDEVEFKIEDIKNQNIRQHIEDDDFCRFLQEKLENLWENFCTRNDIEYNKLDCRIKCMDGILSPSRNFYRINDYNDQFMLLFFNKYLTRTISDEDFINIYLFREMYWKGPKVLDDTEVKHIESSDLEISPDGLEESYFFLSLLHSINMDKQDVISAYENMQRDKQRKHLEDLQEQINNKLEDISSIFNQLYVTKDVTYSFKVELDRKSILFVIHTNKKGMVLDNQSTGFRYFFDLFFYLQSGQISAGDIFVMDEPAINLHPSAQREFRVFLKKIARHYDITMVLATHSPFLIDLNHLDELRIIENKDNVVRIHNTFTAVNYGDPDSLLPIKDALTVENHILVNPEKTIVFVEGITDYNYLTAFKKLFDEKDFIFLPINGVGSDENHCKEISKRLLKIRKDAKVLVDNDTAGKRMKEINAENSELKVVSLADIDENFKEIESLFSNADLEKSELIDGNGEFCKHASTSAVFKKRLANDSSYITDETRNNFKKLFEKLKEMAN